MTMLWLAPLVTTAVGLTAVAVVALRAAEEAARLRRSIGGLGELRPAVVEAGSRVRALREAMQAGTRT